MLRNKKQHATEQVYTDKNNENSSYITIYLMGSGFELNFLQQF